MENRFVPSISKSFNKSLGWKQISGGQHHAIALDKSGENDVLIWQYIFLYEHFLNRQFCKLTWMIV